jgi:hypothetical protein
MLIMADIAACLQVQTQEERPQQMLEAVLHLLKFFCMLMLLLMVLQLALLEQMTLLYASPAQQYVIVPVSSSCSHPVLDGLSFSPLSTAAMPTNASGLSSIATICSGSGMMYVKAGFC